MRTITANEIKEPLSLQAFYLDCLLLADLKSNQIKIRIEQNSPMTLKQSYRSKRVELEIIFNVVESTLLNIFQPRWHFFRTEHFS